MGFRSCDIFNQDLSSWDTGNVQDFSHMFHGGRLFNGNVSGWNVSSASKMSWMFSRTGEFNIDISSWDVRKVTDFFRFAQSAVSFDKNLCAWGERIQPNAMVTEMFIFSRCPTEAYVDLKADTPGPFCHECSN